MATIIGDGTIGKALAKAMGIEALGKSDDPIKDDVVILCVPTETINGVHDQSQVIQALDRIKETKVVVIRSTILPGTTERLQNEYAFPIAFVPEFGFEKTMDQDMKDPKYYVLGLTSKSFNQRQLIKDTLPKADEYLSMQPRSAELCKYMTNIWGCFQVVLANTLMDWSGDYLYYLEALQGAKKHKNIPQWGWNIYQDGDRGYSGKCLPKDIKAAISDNNNPVWQAIDNYNETLRTK